VWDNLIENSGNEQGLDLLKRTVIDLNKLNTLLALDNASGKLSRIAILLIPYEHSASRRALNDLASTEDAEIILNTLDEISLRFPEWPWLKEQKLIKKLIIKNHEFYELLWKKLELDESISLINKLKSIPEILFPFIQILKSIKFINLSKKQSQLLTNLILLKPNWFLNDRNLMIQTATNSNLSVSLTAINLLEARDKIKDYYIQLLESRFPIAFEASQRYLEHVSDSKTLSKTIINICDSSVKEVREQGLIMLRNRIGDYNPYEVHSALAENKAPEISEVVARYALEEGILNLKAIKQFDKRILKTRSTSRKAKNLVKSRLESTHHKNILPIQLNASERKERINTLLALARGLSKRDKEWALLELAKLALSGEKIPSLQINKTY